MNYCLWIEENCKIVNFQDKLTPEMKKKKTRIGTKIEGGNKIVNVRLLEIKLQTIQTVFFLVVP